jgi:hypothetical protein
MLFYDRGAEDVKRNKGNKHNLHGLYLLGKSWYYDTHVKGKRYLGCFGPVTQRQAEKLLQEKRSELFLQHYGILKRSEQMITLEQFVLQKFLSYVKSHHKPSMYGSNTRKLRPFIELWGHRQLKQIKVLDLEDYRTLRIDARIKPSTINREILTPK